MCFKNLFKNKKYKKGKLLIFSAPSGAGKTTVVKHLLGLKIGLEFSISACSRTKRKDERNKRDYYFLSVEKFKEKIANDEFVEWEEVYKDQFYGTLKKEVDRIRNKGNHVVFDVDVKGGMSIKKLYKKDALTIFIKPPSLKVLQKRLKNRGSEDETSLQKRIQKAKYEMSYAKKFDKIIVNSDLSKTLKEAESIVKIYIELV